MREQLISLTQTSLYYICLLFLAFVPLYVFLDWVGILGPQRIKNIPVVEGYPVVGRLFDVLKNPALNYMKWQKEYGDVFQIRMGNRMVVVANSYDSIRELWLKNRDANNSRPMLYTFHSVLSKTQGFTIGTTPYGESYKRKKKVVATSLNKKNVEKYSSLIDFESRGMIRRIEEEMEKLAYTGQDIDMFKLLQGFVLRVSLFITYGYSVKVEHDDKCRLFDEITFVENRIVRMRGHSSNVQDYLPILRYLPFDSKSKSASDLRVRRDAYMTKFMNDLMVRMERGQDDPECLVSKVLRGSELFPKVNHEELESACLTMVSAGLDNTPLVLNFILGQLSQPSYGAKIQSTAICELLKSFHTLESAYTQCVNSPRVDYVDALIKEGLRYFSVLPTGLPRVTTKDICYNGAIIPAGTSMFMNTYSGNHDPKYFPVPFEFHPERYLDGNMKLIRSSESTTMLTFGVGSRMCLGANLAIKEMYVSLVRLLVLYKIEPPQDSRFLMETNPFELNEVPESVAFEPRPYKMRLTIRDHLEYDKLGHIERV